MVQVRRRQNLYIAASAHMTVEEFMQPYSRCANGARVEYKTSTHDTSCRACNPITHEICNNVYIHELQLCKHHIEQQ